MKNYEVTMIRSQMEDIPEIPFPKGFDIRNYRPGEGYIWTRIQRAAEPFIEVDDKLFGRDFGRNLRAMKDRCFFIIADVALFLRKTPTPPPWASQPLIATDGWETRGRRRRGREDEGEEIGTITAWWKLKRHKEDFLLRQSEFLEIL